ncbi:hypothetical protein QVD17_10197 [Tagetes erecta]|uniref:Uncharacterized protein n=1 Tax=Tagetes erecta TaxID=13708 RepID=A0AAD8L7F4_TARER|nr:hypothetical protein QVD17_10197 [Tagetes erecta]
MMHTDGCFEVKASIEGVMVDGQNNTYNFAKDSIQLTDAYDIASEKKAKDKVDDSSVSKDSMKEQVKVTYGRKVPRWVCILLQPKGAGVVCGICRYKGTYYTLGQKKVLNGPRIEGCTVKLSSMKI